jgi:hypothetical protein
VTQQSLITPVLTITTRENTVSDLNFEEAKRKIITSD